MNDIDLNFVNSHAPYSVSRDAEPGYFRFTSDAGVDFLVGFDKDDLLLKEYAYQLVIANVNHKPSPRDRKVKDTITVVIEAFFDTNNVTVLYICETGDGRQKMRSRLFSFWFSSFTNKDSYTMLSASLKDEEGIENYVALISRTDNPHLRQTADEFMQTIQLLSQKPDR